MSFDRAFDKVVGVEGGYVNDPRDSGGETIYGITLRVARAEGYEGPMRDMPLSVARAIYRTKYWDKLRLDQVQAVAGYDIAHELFDTGVNQGTSAAAKYLQRALNALNQQAVLYADVPVDGDLGNLTLAALRSYMRRRGAQGAIVLLRAVNALQGAFYIGLAEQRAKDEAFVYGWILNRVN